MAKLIKGVNDLKSLKPNLAKEWDYEKNIGLTPDMVTCGTDRKVWWICSRGHSWEATIYSRSAGCGCPECSKESKTSFPEQAIFFYFKKAYKDTTNRFQDKKNGITEIDVYIPSIKVGIEYNGFRYHKNIEKDENKKALIQKNGIKLFRIIETEETQTRIKDDDIFIKRKPTFAQLEFSIKHIFEMIGNRFDDINIERDQVDILNLYSLTIKENSFANKFPHLISNWDYEKNKNIKPENVNYGSTKSVWWRCSKGHSYKLSLDRVARGDRCPYCSNHKILKGFNDLATTNPELVKEWDYEKNGNLTPQDVFAASGRKVWWRCSKGHSFESAIYSRKSGISCPICANKKIQVGVNDLSTINPELAKEWDYEKNGKLTPQDVFAASGRKVWWRCSKGHSFESSIYSRNNGAGCPICANRKIQVGVNDLATANPKLAKEWDYEKNIGLTPKDVFAASGRKVWWRCEKGHSWEAAIYSRNAGSSCPYCSNNKILKGENDLATINPDFLKEWDYEKNISILPTEVSICSQKKVWWKCKNGHKWQATIANRKLGRGCPICAHESRKIKKYKRVQCVETGIIYRSVNDACLAIAGKYSSNISSCLKGRREKAFGYHWKYSE